jgi:hypothetical protein
MREHHVSTDLHTRTTTRSTTRTSAARSLRRRVGATLLAVVALTGAACSDDAGTDAAASGTSETSETTVESTVAADHADHGADHGAEQPSEGSGTGSDTPGELVVTATDYAFEDLPESVPAGTKLRIQNESDVELHEIVVFRLPDSEQREFDELMSLDPGALQAATGGPPVAVLVQPPGGPAIDAVGDGTLTEPGRYLLLCSIPTGADPGEYMTAAAKSQGGPVTGVAGGPPHLVHGMAAELLVE